MAEKKNQSQAEKAVSEVKKKSTSSGTSTKKDSKSISPRAAAKKSAKAEKKAKVKTEYDAPIPSALVIALLSLGLFVLFLICYLRGSWNPLEENVPIRP